MAHAQVVTQSCAGHHGSSALVLQPRSVLVQAMSQRGMASSLSWPIGIPGHFERNHGRRSHATLRQRTNRVFSPALSRLAVVVLVGVLCRMRAEAGCTSGCRAGQGVFAGPSVNPLAHMHHDLPLATLRFSQLMTLTLKRQIHHLVFRQLQTAATASPSGVRDRPPSQL
jgi:hypothetical protein